MENELREEKNKLLTVIKEKESEVTKERSELTQRLQEHEQVIEVSRKWFGLDWSKHRKIVS